MLGVFIQKPTAKVNCFLLEGSIPRGEPVQQK
jgi:hypothetical protein